MGFSYKTWGSSWSSFWGDSWGKVATTVRDKRFRGGGGKHKPLPLIDDFAEDESVRSADFLLPNKKDNEEALIMLLCC